MGQYYKPAILKNNKSKSTVLKWAYSHRYESGLKLMEHSYVGNNFVNVIENELKDNPQRLVWAGDYADECNNRKSTLYSRCKDSLEIKDGNEVFDHETYRFVVNHTKKLYVDKSKLKDIEGWADTQINPLPLLTCEGNGRGGGDYSGNNEKLVGSWARDVISIEKYRPTGYKELTPAFAERRYSYA